ncbi:hypothetical protein BOTBODRAFT_642324 [Botryobasidium botryosum FD-172 SS1]|uniref:Uncharacterized protein n=1 Tax=Botryobasidium botryosum (strain FD-172 SS1) TaxID=930990 RepID=A0A067M1I2_BOTB1|nr:hypothetical protein BOTBODRAFT_642324 [Botryobasidium botryosum FD-172 SS1]
MTSCKVSNIRLSLLEQKKKRAKRKIRVKKESGNSCFDMYSISADLTELIAAARQANVSTFQEVNKSDMLPGRILESPSKHLPPISLNRCCNVHVYKYMGHGQHKHKPTKCRNVSESRARLDYAESGKWKVVATVGQRSLLTLINFFDPS